MSQVGIDSISFPVKDAKIIAKSKQIKIIVINKNNENISPFENGLLFPSNSKLLESITRVLKTFELFLFVFFEFVFFEFEINLSS